MSKQPTRPRSAARARARARPPIRADRRRKVATRKQDIQSACKPGFVWPLLTQERGDHSSGTGLAPGL